MNSILGGSPSPFTHQRNIPGSARRPSSGRPGTSRNPITGEEYDYRPPSRQVSRPEPPSKQVSRPEPPPSKQVSRPEPSSRQISRPEPPSRQVSRPESRPQGVPALNLNCFTRDAEVTRPIQVDDYLDSPGSARTAVSWGTPCGTDRSQRQSARGSAPYQYDSWGRGEPVSRGRGSGRSSRPQDVPELQLEEDIQPRSKVKTPKTPKEPSAWDKVPLPDELPPPSAKHKEMYKQYENEMKHSYRTKGQVTNADVDREVAVMKHTRPVTYGDVRDEVDREDIGDSADEDDVIDYQWANKKSYSTKQILKKMDAEEMLEYNKKQKLIETVMVDQLSRAVISDPDQNTRSSSRMADSRRARGSNRSLHDSKVRTNGTATENLLSKRIRFGARVVTRNGHDAMRELTGFFFSTDNTLTIYEFRQFGKSAKALPFIVRGKYCHVQGPRKGELYSLADIVQGMTLIIPSEGQHSLPDTLKKQELIYFTLTDVEEEEKQTVLLSDVRPSARMNAYAKLHIQNKQEYQDRVFLSNLQAEVRKKLKKRGVRTMTGLGRHYRRADTKGTGVLYKYELEEGIIKFHIDLTPDQLDGVFEILDPEERGELDYTVYVHGVIGTMNEYRKTLVRKAFRKVDASKRGRITLNEIKKFFNSSFRPHLNPAISGDSSVSALHAFIDAVQESKRQEEVTFEEFEDYYEGLSIAVDSDDDFANILRNTWSI
ncbi:calcyphosin-2-like isoform X1 [Mizuhopecten yessoensis]|uniref:calcyphosin-2-like isoform X1 n=1 Tax=Mizuhopecten yessoensis TaxID=6573 RepID=UPI000B459D21|nr:calcyphosin-2-like isoform X1 [Mizuhopecten yessoensis]